MSKLELFLTQIAALPASVLAAPFFTATLGRERGDSLSQISRIGINAPPQAVHSLLDPAAVFHRWRLRNEKMEPIDARSGRFRYVVPALEELTFEVQVTRSSPPTLIETATCAENRLAFGAVLSSTGAYEIEPTDSGGCRVKLTETTRFIAGLPPYHRARHAILMFLSMRMDLLRLKSEAETGNVAEAKAA